MSAEVERESLQQEATHIVEEARMALPGIQALFGFQLIGVFSDRFDILDAQGRAVYFIAFLLTAASIALIMTPAAYHRISERGVVTRHFTRLSSAFIAVAMLIFALAINLDLYLIARLILGSGAASIVVPVAARGLPGALVCHALDAQT